MASVTFAFLVKRASEQESKRVGGSTLQGKQGARRANMKLGMWSCMSSRSSSSTVRGAFALAVAMASAFAAACASALAAADAYPSALARAEAAS